MNKWPVMSVARDICENAESIERADNFRRRLLKGEFLNSEAQAAFLSAPAPRSLRSRRLNRYLTGLIIPAMSTQVILNLPDETYQRATQYAAYTNRDVSEVIVAAIASTLPSLEAIEQLRAIAKLSDREVLALTELRMEPKADYRLSELLDRQQARKLRDLERAELAALMRTYEMGLLRQSQALAEAVRRGLIAPLEP